MNKWPKLFSIGVFEQFQYTALASMWNHGEHLGSRWCMSKSDERSTKPACSLLRAFFNSLLSNPKAGKGYGFQKYTFFKHRNWRIISKTNVADQCIRSKL